MDEKRRYDQPDHEPVIDSPATAGGTQQASDARPAAEPVVQPPALPPEGDDDPMPPIARLGQWATRFDHMLSDTIPDAISGASRRSAESTRRTVMSGRWHNYAFLAVLALVALTVVALLARGCNVGGGL
jgi:hypothetical protein